MLSLTNPWVLLTVLALFAGAFGYGQKVSDDAHQAQIAKLNAKARDTEQEMQGKANDHAVELQRTQDEAQAKIDNLQRDVRTGAMRLSIATRPVYTTTVAGAACPAIQESRAELDPEAAAALIAIAADGDKAIRQMNALIDFYNDMRITHNADR